MRLKLRDLIGTLLVLAIAIPYVGYLVRGEMPLVQDPRGMSAVGLLLGTAAFLVVRSGDELDRFGRGEIGLAVVSLALGLAALVFAETAFAEVLLAVFMASILVVWLLEIAHHAGLVHLHGAPTAHA
ncbi:hypothetical protein [Terrabacter terrae]